MKINRSLLAAVLTATLTLSLAAGSALATAPAGAAAQIVVAQSETETQALTQAPKETFTATPSSAGALTITAEPNSLVTLKAKGLKAKSVTTNMAGLAQVKQLTPGLTYTLTTKIDNATKRITATPESTVTPVNSLRVLTTEIPGQLELTWAHANTPAQGNVSFTVTAQPLNSPAEAIGAQTASTEIVFTDLDLKTRFEFSVTASNTISRAIPTSAVMTKSLNDLEGTEQPTPTKPQAAAVTPSGPSTRTIYVCPDTFSEVGGLCEKTMAYTYTNLDYTFHNETRTESCAGPDCPNSQYMDMGYSGSAPHCPNGGTLYGTTCMAWSTSSRTVNVSVKDATPAGFTDTGSDWTKKGALPAGYTDNGTNWVSTTAKVPQVVPA